MWNVNIIWSQMGPLIKSKSAHERHRLPFLWEQKEKIVIVEKKCMKLKSHRSDEMFVVEEMV